MAGVEERALRKVREEWLATIRELAYRHHRRQQPLDKGITMAVVAPADTRS
jgi:hypothetical protein